MKPEPKYPDPGKLQEVGADAEMLLGLMAVSSLFLLGFLLGFGLGYVI